jgi:hypothetical protein
MLSGGTTQVQRGLPKQYHQVSVYRMTEIVIDQNNGSGIGPRSSM